MVDPAERVTKALEALTVDCSPDVDASGLWTDVDTGRNRNDARSITSTVPGSAPMPSTEMNA